jgi:glycerophosphoryl diester phosphodiesterase
VAELLREFGWAGAGSPARVMSFSWTALGRARKLAPELPVVMLLERAHRWPALRQVIDDDWAVGPGVDELRAHPGLVRHLAGRELHVWTVNTPDDLQLCLDLGVTAVITDRPAYVLDLLDV